MKAKYTARELPDSTPIFKYENASVMGGVRTIDVWCYKAKDAEEWHVFVMENGVLQEDYDVYVYDRKPLLETIKRQVYEKYI